MNTEEVRFEAQDLNQQGVMLLKIGNLEAAREKFERAIAIDPMLMDSYKNCGDLYMASNEYQNAKNSYKKALLIEKNGLLHFLYGNACFMNNEPHEGLECYNLAINEGYDSDEMMFFMGMAYEYLNDDNMALRYFRKARIKNPSRADYMVKEISVLVKLGMYERANEATDELLIRSPEVFDGYHIKTLLLQHDKEYDKAVLFAKAASEKFPEDAELLFDYAKALTASKKLDEALEVIRSAKKMKYFDDSKRDFIFLEGQILAENNDYEKAIACCNQCIEIEQEDEFDGEARFMLINLYLLSKNFEKSLKEANEIIARDLNDAYYYAALYYRSFNNKQLNKTEEARKFYKEAISIYRLATLENPAAIDLYLYRAMCLRDIDEYESALDLLNFISDLDENIAEIYTIRADIYNLQGKKALADEQLQKAYELKPELKPDEVSVGE